MKNCLNHKIRELRLEKGLTIQKLAEIINIPASTLGMYERGMRTPDIETVLKISKVFNVDIKYFYDNNFNVDEIITSFKELREDENIEIARKRANGFCELCGNFAPFIKENGEPYLEVHHIKPQNDSRDLSGNIVMVCPNCHRKMEILNLPGDVSYLIRKARRSQI